MNNRGEEINKSVNIFNTSSNKHNYIFNKNISVLLNDCTLTITPKTRGEKDKNLNIDTTNKQRIKAEKSYKK